MYVTEHHSREELSALAKNIHISEVRSRLQIIILAQQLISGKTISQTLGLSRKAIHYWINRYNSQGIEGLYNRVPPGKEMMLTQQEKELFCQRIEQGPIEADKYCTFHGKTLQKVLREEFGKLRSLSSVYYLLHSLGYSCLFPRPRHRFANAKAQEEFKQELPREIEQIRQRLPDKRVEIWFEDEARFGQQGSLTRVWAKKGSRPTAIRQTEYNYLYVLTAVHPQSGKAEGMFFSRLDTEVMNQFLDQMSKAIDADTHVVLILDRAGYHTSKSLKVPPNITLKHLPPYSPELNPVENLWHYLRSHHWANRHYKDLQALEEAAQKAWDQSCINPIIIQSVCRAPYTL